MRKPRPDLLVLLLGPFLMAAQPEPPPPERLNTKDMPLSEVLKQKSFALEAKAAELSQAQADLKLAEAALDKKLAELKGLIERQEAIKGEIVAEQKRLETTRNVMADERLMNLAKVTEKMPPAKAAAYLASLEEPAAANLFKALSVDKAAKIMASLPPSKAAAISRLYLKHDSLREPATGRSP
ncbi:MAG: hypothetical protein IPG45_37790 [Deltaproteobacteria bacterium]|jgi:flagellar motility protein MotE (MotC chaperone)|nr:hypothetical protein [Deltaproteobacteria bacterium]